MKIYFLFISFIFCLGGFSQDPGHCLFVKIIENKKELKGKDLEEYKVELLKERTNFGGKHFLGYNTDSTAFFYFAWNFFGNAIHELRITLQKETMVVRFQIDPQSIYKEDKRAYTEQLYLDIPFMEGYYEITDIVRKKPEETDAATAIMRIKEDHAWINLKADERKLVLEKK